MRISILHLSIFGFTHIKDVCILTELKNCLREEMDPSHPKFITFKTEHRWLFHKNYNEFKRQVKLDLTINDNMDVAIKIQ